MKITKYIHSCLLLEHDGMTVLVDPGSYTLASNIFPIETLQTLDYIVITHSHLDHFSLPFVQALVRKFPEVTIVTTGELVTVLYTHTIVASGASDAVISLSRIPHEALFDSAIPENVQADIFGFLSHPGDSFHATTTKKVFALPMQAPWGSLVEAMQLVARLKPEYVVPIHDWHWKDDFKRAMYQRCTEYLATLGIIFISLEDGVSVDIP